MQNNQPRFLTKDQLRSAAMRDLKVSKSMTEYFGKKYVPIDEQEAFFLCPSFVVAPRLIGCVLHHDNGKDTGIMIVEDEAYDKTEKAIHGNASQLLPGGHAYVHRYTRSKMWALDLVCGGEGDASSVLIRAGIPAVGEDIMIEHRSGHDKTIRERARGFEKKLCRGPCNVAEALGIHPLLDRKSLFKAPFRIYRPVEPVTNLLNGPRANITKDVELPWRWGHVGYSQWLSQPSFPKKDEK
jgi:DNA-3-methyladenine glycosylase